MPSLTSRFDRWIFDSYEATPAGLALYRITYAAFALLFVAPGHGRYASFTSLATLPDALFLPPPGPMQLASGFPSSHFFEALHLCLSVALVAVLFGFYTRTASIATTVLFLVGYGFSYSAGKINHNMLFILLPAVMAFSNWGAAYSFDASTSPTSRRVASWPITFIVLLVGFAMFTAGLPKILGGWLDLSTQATQGRLARQFFVHGRRDLLAPVAIHLDWPLLWELFDIVTVCFEVGFLLAVLHPLATRVFAAGAIAFHTGVMLVLNIAFSFHFIVYAAVLPWTRIARWVPTAFRRPTGLSTVPAWGRGALLLGTATFFYAAGSPLLWIQDTVNFTSDLTLSDTVIVVLAWIVLATVIATSGPNTTSHTQ